MSFERDMERLLWAGSGPTGVASGSPESAPQPPFNCEREIALTARFCRSGLIGLAAALPNPRGRAAAFWIAEPNAP